MVPMTLSQRIKEARDGAGLSNAELARATGRSQGAVTQWLDGSVQSLKADTAAQIERATGYRATWLVTGKGAKRVEESQPAFNRDVLTALEIIGKSLELVADPSARESARSMLVTYINDPKGNLDILPLIAKRISGDTTVEKSGFWTASEDRPQPPATLRQSKKSKP